MKKIILILYSILFLFSCKEKQPVITPNPNTFDIMPSQFFQNILVEKFEGEWCGSCVEKNQQLESLKNNYPNRVKVVSIHQNDWLEIPYFDYISVALGGLSSTPRASFNRKVGEQTYLHLDDTYSLLSPENWESALYQNNKTEPLISIALETQTNASIGTINTYIAYKNPIETDTRLQLYFIEDNIPSVFQQGAVNGVYVHKYVLKEVSSYEGTQIQLNKTEPTIFKYSFNNIDLTKFDLSKLSVVAFVYNFDKDFRKLKVLNVQDVKWGGNKYWDYK